MLLVGTLTVVMALSCSPKERRRPSARASIANFGTHSPRRADYVNPEPEVVLGRVLHGFADEERDDPWITFEPNAIPAIRREVLAAVARADAESARDEYADWFASQLRSVDHVLAHAEKKRHWFVSVFEGQVPCFLEGGDPHYEPADHMFSPHCTLPPARRPFVPLGIAGVLTVGLAVAGWRYRRFLSLRSP